MSFLAGEVQECLFQPIKSALSTVWIFFQFPSLFSAQVSVCFSARTVRCRVWDLPGSLDCNNQLHKETKKR